MNSERSEDRNARMYRAMKAELDGFPRVGRSGRELGVRVEGPRRDLAVSDDGVVEPRSGGMSVALDALENLPKPRLPKLLGGEGRDPVFVMLVVETPEPLVVRADRYPHAMVEPRRRSPLSYFESILAGTRILWRAAL